MSERLPPDVEDFLGRCKTLTLATCSREGAWAATFTYVSDGSDFYFWTRPGSLTCSQLDENPTAAFTIDEYADDWRQTKGVQGRGEVTVVQGEGIARAADLFGRKYPELRPGSTSAVVFFHIEPSALEYIDNSRGVDEGADFGAEYRRESVFDLPAIEG